MRACLLITIALYSTSAAPANKTLPDDKNSLANKADVTPRSSCTCPSAYPRCNDVDNWCYATDGSYSNYGNGCGARFGDECSLSAPPSPSPSPTPSGSNDDDDDDAGSPSEGCRCSSDYPNCLENGAVSMCVSDEYTECGQLADGGVGCSITSNFAAAVATGNGFGCGEKLGPNCGESHPSGKLGALNNVGENIGIIIAYVAGGLVASAILTCLIKYFCEKKK